ncbi:MAG: hypothetical protein JSR59_24735 [Proteobacteria bacterium]|nr:hypothetical protein [Pseudomonadota bacterium]
MALSVRMDPLMERELELAAKRKGVTKSQFIIEAVERALGRKDAHALMVQLKAEERQPKYRAVKRAFEGQQQDYETDSARAALIAKLRAKHGLGPG